MSQQDIAEASKQRQISGKFILGFLTKPEEAIVTTPAVELVKQLKDRSLTAVTVAKAFCKTAALAHQILSLFPRLVVILYWLAMN